MEQIHVRTLKSDLMRAAQQEALRWQAYVWRLPLFLLTLLVLYGLGVGLLRNAAQMTLFLQIFAVLGYAVFYWMVFTLGRLIQGFFHARKARRARFRDTQENQLELTLGEDFLKIREGPWHSQIPCNRIYSIYTTRDFVFIQCPYLPWLPLPKSPELVGFLADLKRAPDKIDQSVKSANESA